ncbi:hypothetical protein GpartN1_g4338.t1 [Galdieria partita]|uniref:BRK domain-containing protein n=1 Tax=Galdieria partita TaxID=83374 RepID=A0A9C7URI0_9RHOD|nr:hypothetical protein GpartN1_g4338.t1 [Galdieria partita]
MFPGQPYETRRGGLHQQPFDISERRLGRGRGMIETTFSSNHEATDMTMDMMTPEEGSQHVTIWNRIECRKVAGNAAPLRRNLERYLAKHPECEVYAGQDKNLSGGIAIGSVDPKTGSTIVAGNEHVPMWNKIEERKITGNAAPLRKNVAAYLAKHPECEVYVGQDRDSSMIGQETKKGKVVNKRESSSIDISSRSRDVSVLQPSQTTQDSFVTNEGLDDPSVLREEQVSRMDSLSHENISMSLDSNSGVLMDQGNAVLDTGTEQSHPMGGSAQSPTWNEQQQHHNNILWQSSNVMNNYSSSWNRSLLASNNLYGYSPNNPPILPPIHGRAVPIPGRDSLGNSNYSIYGMEDASWSSTLFVGSYGAGSGLTPLTGSLDMELYPENMSPSVFLLSGQSPVNATPSNLRYFPWKNMGGGGNSSNFNNYSTSVIPNNNSNNNNNNPRAFMGMPQRQ